MLIPACAIQVVRFLREHPHRHGLLDMLAYFHPDYIVLRPAEYEIGLSRGYTWLASDYEMIATFETPEEEKAQLLFPDSNLDVKFYLLRRTAIIPEAPLASVR